MTKKPKSTLGIHFKATYKNAIAETLERANKRLQKNTAKKNNRPQDSFTKKTQPHPDMIKEDP